LSTRPKTVHELRQRNSPSGIIAADQVSHIICSRSTPAARRSRTTIETAPAISVARIPSQNGTQTA
jgi:hypothetical protein